MEWVLFVALSWGYGVSTQAIPMETEKACESAKVAWLASDVTSSAFRDGKAVCIKVVE
jgi:hypothetical protein